MRALFSNTLALENSSFFVRFRMQFWYCSETESGFCGGKLPIAHSCSFARFHLSQSKILTSSERDEAEQCLRTTHSVCALKLNPALYGAFQTVYCLFGVM